MRRNAFDAKPTKFAGRQMLGVISHPGFHTTDRYSVACSYAYAKVDSQAPTEISPAIKKGWEYPMTDYPVVVSLVMNGLGRLPDYDAFEYWEAPANGFLESFLEHGDVDDGVFGLARFEEDGVFEYDTPENALDALASILDGNPYYQVGGRITDWVELQPDPDGALNLLLSSINHLPPRFLMEITRQYRYTDNVNASRICSVDYMKPFFDYLFPHYDDPEWEKRRIDDRLANIEAAGYATVNMNDVYDDIDPTQVTNVFSIDPNSITPDTGQTLFPWGSHKPRVEFHGTSYKNLISAAPNLPLPVPPPPYEEE